MSQTAEQESVGAASAAAAPPATMADLSRMLSRCSNRRSAYRIGLDFIADQFESPYVALRLDVDGGSVEQHVSANPSAEQSWSRICDGLILRARYHQTSQARFFQSQGVDHVFAVLTVPLIKDADDAVGAVAVVVACDRHEVARARLSELQATTAIIDLQAEGSRQGPSPPEVSSAFSKVAAYKSLAEFCFALTNTLKSNLGCDQVALGMVRGKSVELTCISGFDDLHPRSPGSQFIQQAMCECLDAAEIVCYQVSDSEDRSKIKAGRHLHKKWSASLGASPVASIPIFSDGTCTAIVSIRNPTHKTFSQRQLEKVQELVSPLAQGMMLLERANLSATRRARQYFVELGKSLADSGSPRRNYAIALLLAIAAWVAFGTISYRPAVSCVLEADGELQLSAPYAGTVAESFVRPGERVTAGQILARMDTRSLETERDQLQSELRRAQAVMTEAAQSGDLSRATEAHAEAAIASAQMHLVEQKLQAAAIRAPHDGVILEGRLEPRVGEVVALGEPLMKFAPQDQWKVHVHVPDHLAVQIAEGQLAELATAARPDVISPLRIDRIHAASQVEQGENVFTAEASFEGTPPDWIRAGMTGTTRVDVGRRPVWWVWAHRVVDSLRLLVWRM